MTLDAVPTLVALGAVAAAWLALGWLSSVRWPGDASAPARWSLRLLVGAWLVGLAQLALALLGPGFGNLPLVLGVAALFGGAFRGIASAAGAETGAQLPQSVIRTRERSGWNVGETRERSSGNVGATHQRSGRKVGQTHERSGWNVGETRERLGRNVPNARERIGWIILGAVLLAATARAVIVPEAGWDAYSHWGLKAHAFATQGTIVNAGTTHEYYPPLVPLLEAWLLQHRDLASTVWPLSGSATTTSPPSGGASTTSPLSGVSLIDVAKTVWPLIGAAFAICIAEHLRRTLRHTWLAPYAATAIVLATTQLLESFWTGQADLALATYLTLASLAAFQWLRSAHRVWLVQLAIFAAAGALTKHEGLPRLGVLAAALVLEAMLIRKRSSAVPAAAAGYGSAAAALARSAAVPAAAVALGAAIGYAPWLLFRALHGIQVTSEHLSQFQPQAIGNVIMATAASVAGVRTGGGILAAALAWLAAGRLLFQPPLRILALTVAGQLAATLLAFLISETTPEVQVRTSATRLLEQFMPVALFVSAVALERVLLGHTDEQALNGKVDPQALRSAPANDATRPRLPRPNF